MELLLTKQSAWPMRVLLLALAGFGCFAHAAESGRDANAATNSLYEFHSEHDPDGIGKFYCGREIAHVMGHQGATWLERPERVPEEAPDLLLDALKLAPGEVVADIGAGSGYFTRRIARQVAPGGKVFAVDIQPEMLALLSNSIASLGLTNIVPVLGTVADPRLAPASVDLVLMVDVYHELEFPYEMMQAICQAMKPGGRVVLVEYRAEDPAVPIKPLHKMTVAQVKKEMSVLPLSWVEAIETLPRQHILVFRKNRLSPPEHEAH